MKTIINRKVSLAFLAIASLSISSFASGEIRITNIEGSSKAKVEIEVPVREDIKFSVKDEEGSRIDYDVVKKNSEYYKVFDLSQFDEGQYTYVTETGHTTITRTIELKDNSISEINREYAYKPIFKIEGDLLIVYFLNQTNEDVTISLEAYMTEYYIEEADDSTTYEKMLSLKNLSSGDYNLSLAVGDKEYNYNFRR